MARQGDPYAIDRLDNGPELPPLAAHLWSAFCDIAPSRASGFGIERISRAAIRQWEADELTTLSHWERRTILALDAEYVRMAAERQEKKA